MLTTTDILTLPHVAALCRAIDAGDDSALPILADALEEIGDPRAPGLRQSQFAPVPSEEDVSGPFWLVDASQSTCPPSEQVLPSEVFDRLQGGSLPPEEVEVVARVYPTLSAAYLALAEALIASPEPRWVAVWGFGSSSGEVGELDRFPTREEAEACARDYLSREANPAVGAWVRPLD